MSNDEFGKKKTPEKKEKNKYTEEEGDWYTLCKIYLNRIYIYIYIYIYWHCVANDEVPSTSSQIVEKIEVFQGVFLPGISKLNKSAADKKPRNQPQFSPKKKTPEKGKWISCCILYLLSH